MPTPACAGWPGIRLTSPKPAKRSAAFIRDGNRAHEIIGRIHALAKKAPPKKDWLDLNETIGEAIAMARSELRRNHVSLQTKLANDLPSYWEIESNCNK